MRFDLISSVLWRFDPIYTVFCGGLSQTTSEAKSTPLTVVGFVSVCGSGGVIEAAMSYTGDVSDPTKTKYNLDYYMDLSTQLIKAGTHILGIKVCKVFDHSTKSCVIRV